MPLLRRRQFLQTGAAATLATLLPTRPAAVLRSESAAGKKLPVAGIATIYYKDSHADVILGKILEGYQQDGGAGPQLELVSLYVDQFRDNDMSRALAAKHGFRLTKTIDDAVTLGTDQLQVAGVLSIGEHGDYPAVPQTKQVPYPRRRFFDEIVSTFRRCGKTVPVFNDKHLSYRWEDARFMVDTARDMRFPLLAGSSIPVARRFPVLELPRDCEIEAALGVGHGGLEAYGFHALEGLQCLIERRRGGETGVAAVQAVAGDALHRAQADGRWSQELLDALLKIQPNIAEDTQAWINEKNNAAYLIEHRDGLKSAVLMANGLVREFGAAVKLKGRPEPIAVWFKLQPGRPYGHFGNLLDAIDQTIHLGRAVYPVERTLLTTGVLDRVMHSLAEENRRFETPELDVAYQATDWPFANHPNSKLVLPND